MELTAPVKYNSIDSGLIFFEAAQEKKFENSTRKKVLRKLDLLKRKILHLEKDLHQMSHGIAKMRRQMTMWTETRNDR